MAGGLQRHQQPPLPVLNPGVPDGRPRKVPTPNVVKTLLAADGRGLYFSRSAIPARARYRASPMAPAPPPKLGPCGHLRLIGHDVLARWAGCPPRRWSRSKKLGKQLRPDRRPGTPWAPFPLTAISSRWNTAEQLEQARALPQRAVGLAPPAPESCSRNSPPPCPPALKPATRRSFAACAPMRSRA